jgi:glycosyltransferase involved in cell wall biosynthesis
MRTVLQQLAGAPPATLETAHANAAWSEASPRLSIVIPTYADDASPLIRALAELPGADAVEIVVYDDGSCDSALLARMEAAADCVATPVRIVASAANRGRAGARNRAVAHARAEWLLLLDADMAPDFRNFLTAYLSAAAGATGPQLVVGGYSLRQAPFAERFALHRWQARNSDCIRADERAKAPGRYVFTSNVLAHRRVLDACPFDEAFAGWGWEDADWGLRVHAQFPIVHIDNNATHLGLDDDTALMGKYGCSGANFALLARRHPKPLSRTPLYRAVATARRLPFRPQLTAATARIVNSHRLPVGVRGRALRAWRALVYAEAL